MSFQAILLSPQLGRFSYTHYSSSAVNACSQGGVRMIALSDVPQIEDGLTRRQEQNSPVVQL